MGERCLYCCIDLIPADSFLKETNCRVLDTQLEFFNRDIRQYEKNLLAFNHREMILVFVCFQDPQCRHRTCESLF